MEATTKEAMEDLINNYNYTKYRIAQDLGAAPPSVYQWLNGTRMSKAYALEVKKRYGIIITDAV